MANPQAKTHAHDLSKYGSSDAPGDWSDEGAGYSPLFRAIWAAWLPVLALMLSLPTLSGKPATIIDRSDSWELVHLSLGECFWLYYKLNIWPFAFPYGGKPTDVYSK